MSSSKEAAALSPALTMLAVAVTASVSTYVVTQYVNRKVDQKNRIQEYQDRKAHRDKKQTEQKERGEPSGTLVDDIKIENVYLWDVENLGHRFPSEGKLDNYMTANPVSRKTLYESQRKLFRSSTSSINTDSECQETPYNKLISNNECVLAKLVQKPQDGNNSTNTVAYVRAGPRKHLHFDPKKVNAAIVTCGGLCPGLNNVIRDITNTLFHLYAINGTVYGIRGGFKGFYDPKLQPISLTSDMVNNIHHQGGTILGSSRGGFDTDKIINFLVRKDIKQLYVIGGDGTHRGAFKIHETCMERGLNVAVAGIPKTIDNDVDYIDRSFGFSSSVEAAQLAIRSAKTEAKCNLPNGIGIVKLMGRSAGFIAVHATLSSGDVDLCLVPEVPIELEGENGCLPHLRRRVKLKGYAVVVVAEGAGEEILGTSAETDASGNKKLPKIGELMKKKVEEHFKEDGETAIVKYIDPSYMIRSVPANAADSLYCMQLGQNAVHGAMAGFTGFAVGLCNNRMVFLPIPELVATSPRCMNPRGRTWERVLAITRQPNTVPPPAEGENPYDSHAPMLR